MSDQLERLTAALADRYRIERRLGEGGMATVYLADDLKHDRNVALKVLKPELAAVLGAERFVQEIKTTASLQHPNILPLFDSGEAGGFLYYVMPYIEGETLRDKLDRETQLAIDETLRVASELADALDYAHRHNVIHRDIKPENILLHDGRPMVADFGIALAVSAAAGGRMTETGLSLGTPHYMSPEQATAEKEITARSDIYSLGSVCYEMLTGEPPHMGTSAQQIIMKIVTEDVAPVTNLRKSVPPNVAAAVSKSLEKLPADRFDSAKAFADALGNPTFTVPLGARAPAAEVAAPRSPVTVALATVAVVSTVTAIWALQREPSPASPVWYEMALPEPLGSLVNVPLLTMSADGERIVYSGVASSGSSRQLYVRERSSLNAHPMNGTDGGIMPAVSPDGQRVAFVSGSPRRLRIVSVTGGGATVIADAVGSAGMTWADDDYLYLGGPNGLVRVFTGGGSIESVGPPADTSPALWPDVLPGARAVIFSTGIGEQSQIVVMDLESGNRRSLTPGVFARYAGTGHLLVVTHDGVLLAGQFDEADGTLGALVALREGVRVNPAGHADLAVGHGNRLVYIGGPSVGDAVDEAVWVNRQGQSSSIDSTWQFASSGNSGWALSPDGNRLAIKINSGGGQDIWVRDLTTRSLQRVTFDPADDFRPRWSPDGRWILFVSVRAGQADVYQKRADGTGTAERVLDLPEPIFEAIWAPDGRHLLARAGATSMVETGRDIWVKSMTGDTVTRPLIAGPGDERAMAVSPAGRWIAFQSDQSGTNEVYIRPFPDVDAGQWQVSVGGGSAPLWARDGREVFYVNPRAELVVADLSNGPTSIGTRTVLFPFAGFRVSTNYTWFDIHPDGERFIMVRETRNDGRVIVVENFLEELKALQRD